MALGSLATVLDGSTTLGGGFGPRERITPGDQPGRPAEAGLVEQVHSCPFGRSRPARESYPLKSVNTSGPDACVNKHPSLTNTQPSELGYGLRHMLPLHPYGSVN